MFTLVIIIIGVFISVPRSTVRKIIIIHLKKDKIDKFMI